ncbi:hypothetical protein CHK_0370 [Christensenella hongkongensis]|uniref:Uncharacterized protein n=1 Tax=Christensenella hongkongensis TaxID=270498 RepID=A0A0M2NM92_9FIRM|nr:hypothetical protein CHK_0370 [Christensenella hongkongensis]
MPAKSGCTVFDLARINCITKGCLRLLLQDSPFISKNI